MTQDDTLARGPLVQVRAPMLAIRERQQAAIARLGLRALAGTAVDELLDAVVDTLAGELELEHAGVLELKLAGEGVDDRVEELVHRGSGQRPQPQPGDRRLLSLADREHRRTNLDQRSARECVVLGHRIAARAGPRRGAGEGGPASALRGARGRPSRRERTVAARPRRRSATTAPSAPCVDGVRLDVS